MKITVRDGFPYRLPHYDWVLRCHQCSQLAAGHGSMPEHDTPFVCGQCVRQDADD